MSEHSPHRHDAMSAEPDRQLLWELVYDLLDEPQASVVRERIREDEAWAAAYANVVCQAQDLGAASLICDEPLSLAGNVPAAAAPSPPPRSANAPRHADDTSSRRPAGATDVRSDDIASAGAPMNGNRRFAGFLAAAAALLLMVAVSPALFRPPQPQQLAQQLRQLTITAPADRSGEWSARLKSFTGRPLADTEIRLTVNAGERSEEIAAVSDEQGSATFALDEFGSHVKQISVEFDGQRQELPLPPTAAMSNLSRAHLGLIPTAQLARPESQWLVESTEGKQKARGVAMLQQKAPGGDYDVVDIRDREAANSSVRLEAWDGDRMVFYLYGETNDEGEVRARIPAELNYTDLRLRSKTAETLVAGKVPSSADGAVSLPPLNVAVVPPSAPGADAKVVFQLADTSLARKELEQTGSGGMALAGAGPNSLGDTDAKQSQGRADGVDIAAQYAIGDADRPSLAGAGRVVDAEGQLLDGYRSDTGEGELSFAPQAGDRYTVEWVAANGQAAAFSLQSVSDPAVAVSRSFNPQGRFLAEWTRRAVSYQQWLRAVSTAGVAGGIGLLLLIGLLLPLRLAGVRAWAPASAMALVCVLLSVRHRAGADSEQLLSRGEAYLQSASVAEAEIGDAALQGQGPDRPLRLALAGDMQLREPRLRGRVTSAGEGDDRRRVAAERAPQDGAADAEAPAIDAAEIRLQVRENQRQATWDAISPADKRAASKNLPDASTRPKGLSEEQPYFRTGDVWQADANVYLGSTVRVSTNGGVSPESDARLRRKPQLAAERVPDMPGILQQESETLPAAEAVSGLTGPALVETVDQWLVAPATWSWTVPPGAVWLDSSLTIFPSRESLLADALSTIGTPRTLDEELTRLQLLDASLQDLLESSKPALEKTRRAHREIRASLDRLRDYQQPQPPQLGWFAWRPGGSVDEAGTQQAAAVLQQRDGSAAKGSDLLAVLPAMSPIEAPALPRSEAINGLPSYARRGFVAPQARLRRGEQLVATANWAPDSSEAWQRRWREPPAGEPWSLESNVEGLRARARHRYLLPAEAGRLATIMDTDGDQWLKTLRQAAVDAPDEVVVGETWKLRLAWKPPAENAGDRWRLIVEAPLPPGIDVASLADGMRFDSANSTLFWAAEWTGSDNDAPQAATAELRIRQAGRHRAPPLRIRRAGETQTLLLPSFDVTARPAPSSHQPPLEQPPSDE